MKFLKGLFFSCLILSGIGYLSGSAETKNTMNFFSEEQKSLVQEFSEEQKSLEQELCVLRRDILDTKNEIWDIEKKLDNLGLEVVELIQQVFCSGSVAELTRDEELDKKYFLLGASNMEQTRSLKRALTDMQFKKTDLKKKERDVIYKIGMIQDRILQQFDTIFRQKP